MTVQILFLFLKLKFSILFILTFITIIAIKIISNDD